MNNYEGLMFYLINFFAVLGILNFALILANICFWVKNKITEIKNRPKYISLKELAERLFELVRSTPFHYDWILKDLLANSEELNGENLKILAHYLIEYAPDLYRKDSVSSDDFYIYVRIRELSLPYALDIFDVYVKASSSRSIIKKTLELVQSIPDEWYRSKKLSIIDPEEKLEKKKGIIIGPGDWDKVEIITDIKEDNKDATNNN